MKERTRSTYALWFRVAGLVLVATALVALVSGFFSRKFHLRTGEASWIWIEHDVSERSPIAFFAVKDVDIPPDPPIVRLRIACDAEWALHLNGKAIAGGESEEQPSLYSFDLAEIVRKGETNTFMVALRSADGVGGLLVSLDFAPLRENDVVSDSSWTICREWDDHTSLHQDRCKESPRVLGLPPFGRWNYPTQVEGSLYPDGTHSVDPADVFDGEINRKEIRVIDGLAVESIQSLPATLYDFGMVEGRGRITLPTPTTDVRMIEVRYGVNREDLANRVESESFVFAAGERAVTASVPRRFRYLAVAAPNAIATVVEEIDGSTSQ